MGHTGEFELLVLLAILRLGEDAYGVTIREEVEGETSRSLTLGTVYKTLGRLEGKGYLSTRVAPPTRERGGRRKKLYHLTPTGLEATRRSLGDLRRLADGLEPELRVP
jgi:PadR family transcriptional regulator PadR